MVSRTLFLTSALVQAGLSMLFELPESVTMSAIDDYSDVSEIHDIKYPREDPGRKQLAFGIEGLSAAKLQPYYEAGQKQIQKFVTSKTEQLSGFKPQLKKYFQSINVRGCPITYIDDVSEIFEKYDFYAKRLGEGSFGGVFYSTAVNTGRQRGSFGTTQEGTLSRNVMKDTASQSMPREFAVKIQAPRSDTDVLHFGNEVAIQWSLGGHGRNAHPNIAQLYEVFVADDFVVLVQEFVNGLPLLDFVSQVERLEEDRARYLFVQLKAAVGHLHRNGAAHRDIKADNILMTDSGILKLIDFGLATWVEETPRNDRACGSPFYGAPEILKYGAAYHKFERQRMSEEELKAYDFSSQAADLWAMGMTLYAMMCGRFPFNSNDYNKIFSQTKSHRAATMALPGYLSPHVKNILKIYLNENWDTRLQMVTAGVPWPKKSEAAYLPVSQAVRARRPVFQLEVPDWGPDFPELGSEGLTKTGTMPNLGRDEDGKGSFLA